jgi:hypothetical protein
MLADKSAAPLPLSWQPPPVTKCGECPFMYRDINWLGCCGSGGTIDRKSYAHNKDGVTPTCPMYQQQKASLDADKELK